MMKLSMRGNDGQHQIEGLKTITQSNLGQNNNTPTIECLLSLYEEINFRMLKAVKKC